MCCAVPSVAVFNYKKVNYKKIVSAIVFSIWEISFCKRACFQTYQDVLMCGPYCYAGEPLEAGMNMLSMTFNGHRMG